jgi:hypothetical protein
MTLDDSVFAPAGRNNAAIHSEMNDPATAVSLEWCDEIEETRMKDLCKGMSEPRGRAEAEDH